MHKVGVTFKRWRESKTYSLGYFSYCMHHYALKTLKENTLKLVMNNCTRSELTHFADTVKVKCQQIINMFSMCLMKSWRI